MVMSFEECGVPRFIIAITPRSTGTWSGSIHSDPIKIYLYSIWTTCKKNKQKKTTKKQKHSLNNCKKNMNIYNL